MIRDLQPKLGPIRGFAIAILSVAISFAITYGTWPALRPTPWALSFAAVLTSAWFGGMGPSLLATTLAAVLGAIFFVAPDGPASTIRSGAIPTGMFLVVSLFIAVLASARRRAEATERAERRRFQATMSSIGDAVIATDAEGRVRFMNSVAEELTGWPAGEAEGRPLEEIFAIVNEMTRDPVPNPVAKVLETGRIQGLANSTVLIARDGTERPIDDSAAPIRGDDEPMSGVVLVFRDISERKESEAIRARLAAIVESSDDAIIGKTLDGIIRYWNTGAERVFGYPAAEAIGRPITLIIPPERLDEEREILERLGSGERIDHFETVRVAKDGRRVDISLTVSPIRDEYGQVVGASKVARDVTGRKAAEAELARLAEALGLALDAADLGTWDWDPESDRIILSGRGAEIYGVEPGRAYSREWMRSRLHPSDRDRARAEASKSIASRSDYDIEYRLARPEAGSAWVSVRGRGVYDEGGRLLRVLGIVQDVTARKEAEEGLRSSEARHRFLAELAAETQPLSDPEEIMAASARLLAEHLGADRCAYAEVEGEDVYVITGDHARGVPSIVGRWALASFGAEHRRMMLAGEPYVVVDADSDPRIGPDALPAFRATDIRAVICVPLHKEGRLTAAMAVHQKVPRHWSPAEIDLVTTVAGHCWEALERSRIARDLRESEARYRAIVETTPECVKLVAPDGALLQMNPAGLAMIEGDESILGQCVYGVIAPEFRDAFREFNERICRGERGTFEFDIIGLRGTRRHMESTAVPMAIPRGGLAQLAVTRDVTARKQYAAVLREKEERLKLLIDNTKDYAVVISDPSGTVLEWQGAAERITGYAPEEAVGRGPGLIFTPEDRAEGRPEQEMAKAEREGRAEDRRWHRRKDGSRFYADGVMTALLDDSGRLRGFGKVFKDASREKRDEEATKRRAAQLHRLAGIANRINSAHDVNSVIRVVTEEARHLFGAHQAATSMVLDPQFPQPINVVSNSEGRDPSTPAPVIDALAFYEAVDRANEPIRLTREEIGTSPSWRALRELAVVGSDPNGWLAAPLVGRNGRNMGLIQLADRSEGEFTEDDQVILVQLAQLAAIAVENARLYEELRSNDERKNEFLAMLAHELRNPLAAISNAVRLTTRSEEREHIEWSMGVIVRQMQHLSRLIDDLMDVSRITRGKIELRRDLVEATPILESAAATARPLAEERRHALDLEIERGALWINADPTRLEQVVVNLLNNAAKYSENGGHIRLRARNEAGEVVISVKDRGVGIPPEKLPEMFELFVQGDRSLARSEGGLGIGLTVVKKLVEMHGGTVVARSEGPGRGSEFTIRLPAATKPAEAQPSPSGPERGGTRKAKILVVDDNIDSARGMVRLLTLMGHEVTAAHNGREAIEVARGCRPEFILLDIGLPGMSGYEVAAQLRREECCRESLIIAVSGYGQEEDRQRSREAGFDFHLVKPLDYEVLMALLSGDDNHRRS